MRGCAIKSPTLLLGVPQRLLRMVCSPSSMGANVQLSGRLFLLANCFAVSIAAAGRAVRS